MQLESHTERVQTVIIGAGQAGLSAGYYLTRRGLPFVILDANNRIGDSWRNRWDSLHLFTPARYDGLAGMPFPAPGQSFPSKNEMADYLEAYAKRFELPVRTGIKVDGLSRQGGHYLVTAGDRRFQAEHVIIAMALFQHPRTPTFATELHPGILQIHSRDYRNPSQLRGGDVLIVGAGNSGAEIGVEVARTHPVLLAGRNVGQIPIDTRNWQGKLMFPLIWWAWEHVLTEKTKPGRKVQAGMLQGHGDPLIRLKDRDLVEAGITRTARIAGVCEGRPQTEDGDVLDVANVIWATGFKPDFAWLDLPGLDSSGHLDSERGAVKGQPGLYVLGQDFQYMFNSHTVGGVGKDAAYVVRHLDRQGADRRTGRSAVERI
jgi:putative flavoprotein involved in K+ transport